MSCVEPLASGLGLRRFYRVRTAGTPASLIARVEADEDPAGRPAGQAPEPALEPLRTFLADLGLPVPAHLGAIPAHGIELLEDFGDRNLERAVHGADAATRTALYRAVLAWIPTLQEATDRVRPLPTHRRRLDRALVAYKGELFARYSLPAALGRAPDASEIALAEEVFARIADDLASAPLRLAHRDLQSQNVMVLALPGDEPPRVGMIDFQGAFLAPPEYDLVALLRDSYVELPDAEVAGHLDWILPQLPAAPDRATLQHRFDLLTLARKGKDHARFEYARETRGDARWDAHLPRTARALRDAARRLAPRATHYARFADWAERLVERPCAG